MSKAQLPGSMIAHHLSHFSFAEQYVDKILVNYLDTVMDVDPDTRQTFLYANQVHCENNPQNVIALDADTDQSYVLTSQPIKFNLLCALTPLLLKMQVCILKKKSNFFWNRLLFTKHSVKTLQLPIKAISYESLSEESTELLLDNPYKPLRIGMTTCFAFLTPEWFTDAFNKLLGYPCWILTHCGIYVTTVLFLRFAFNALLTLQRSFSVKRNPKSKSLSFL